MATNQYNLHIVLPENLIGPMFELIKGEAKVVSLTPVETPPDTPAPKAARTCTPPRRTGGRVMEDGTTALDLGRRFLMEHDIVCLEPLRCEFTAHGFAASTADSTMHSLVKAREAFHVGVGQWRSAKRPPVSLALKMNGGEQSAPQA